MTSGEVDRPVADLRAQRSFYEGRLPPPKGEVPEDWEDREQTLFRATAFGDDIDRPLSNRTEPIPISPPTRLYAQTRFTRIQGADLCARRRSWRLCQAAGGDRRGIAGRGVKVIVRLCQLVKLFRSGEPVRMSKRAGEFVTFGTLSTRSAPTSCAS